MTSYEVHEGNISEAFYEFESFYSALDTDTRFLKRKLLNDPEHIDLGVGIKDMRETIQGTIKSLEILNEELDDLEDDIDAAEQEKLDYEEGLIEPEW